MGTIRSVSVLHRVVEYLIVVGVSVALGVGLVRDHRVALIVAACVIMLIALLRPFIGYVLLVISAFSVRWLISIGILPDAASLMLDVLAVVLAAALLVRLLRDDERRPAPPGIKWLLGFLLVGVLSGVVNASSMNAALLGMRGYLRYIPLFVLPWAFRWDLTESRKIVRLLVILLLLQPPVTGLQFLLRSVSTGDVVGGTVGGMSSGVLTVMTIAATTLFAGFVIYRAIPTWMGMAAVLAMCAPPALNETKVFFVAAPIVWSMVIVPRMGRNIFGTILVLVAVGAGFVGVYQSYTSIYGDWFARQGSAESMLSTQVDQAVVEGGVMNRIPQVIFAGQLISEDAATLLFGFGPGSLTRSDQAGVEGTLIQRYGALLRNSVFMARLLLEYGLAGLLCFGGLVWGAFGLGRDVERESGVPFWRAVGMGLQGTVLTLSMLSVYTGTFITDAAACMVWLLAGASAVVLWRTRETSGIGVLDARS